MIASNEDPKLVRVNLIHRAVQYLIQNLVLGWAKQVFLILKVGLSPLTSNIIH